MNELIIFREFSGTDNVNCVDNNIVDGIVETRLIASLPHVRNQKSTQPQINATTNSPQINDPIPIKNQQMIPNKKNQGSISTVIRSYKSVVSKYARKFHADFAWQHRFHDHVIRNS